MKKEIVKTNSDRPTFTSEAQCQTMENQKFHYNITCLTNEQLVRLISYVLYWEFYYIDHVVLHAKLEVQISGEDEIEFIFTSKYDVLKGMIAGTGKTDVQVFGTNIISTETKPYVWIREIGFPLRKVYKYLESISFFQPLESQPSTNPNLICGQYTVIFEAQTEPGKPFFVSEF